MKYKATKIWKNYAMNLILLEPETDTEKYENMLNRACMRIREGLTG